MPKSKNNKSLKGKPLGLKQVKQSGGGYSKGETLPPTGPDKFDTEAQEVESVIQKSFGPSTTEYKRREGASYRLSAVAAHWTDGDAKKLVLSLAKRYGHRVNLKISNEDLLRPLAVLISSPRNSRCNTAKLSQLDWQRGWWTDDSFGMHYLHVYHKDGETIHRVYCRHCEQPRIEQKNGKLYWLFCK
jgi:hypothetical protein